MIGLHRPGCGCAYCLHPSVTRAVDDGSAAKRHRAMAIQTEQQLQELLNDTPDDWYGGREVSDGPKQYHFGCRHAHKTAYPSGTFCRDCGRWVEG